MMVDTDEVKALVKKIAKEKIDVGIRIGIKLSWKIINSQDIHIVHTSKGEVNSVDVDILNQQMQNLYEPYVNAPQEKIIDQLAADLVTKFFINKKYQKQEKKEKKR